MTKYLLKIPALPLAETERFMKGSVSCAIVEIMREHKISPNAISPSNLELALSKLGEIKGIAKVEIELHDDGGRRPEDKTRPIKKLAHLIQLLILRARFARNKYAKTQGLTGTDMEELAGVPLDSQIMNCLHNGSELEPESLVFMSDLKEQYEEARKLRITMSSGSPLYRSYMNLIGTPTKKYNEHMARGEHQQATGRLLTLRKNIHDQAAFYNCIDKKEMPALLEKCINSAHENLGYIKLLYAAMESRKKIA